MDDEHIIMCANHNTRKVPKFLFTFMFTVFWNLSPKSPPDTLPVSLMLKHFENNRAMKWPCVYKTLRIYCIYCRYFKFLGNSFLFRIWCSVLKYQLSTFLFAQIRYIHFTLPTATYVAMSDKLYIIQCSLEWRINTTLKFSTSEKYSKDIAL